MKHYLGDRTIDGVKVTVDGGPLDPRLQVREFTRNGFEWSYEGPEPRQLALALLADHLGDGALDAFAGLDAAITAKAAPAAKRRNRLEEFTGDAPMKRWRKSANHLSFGKNDPFTPLPQERVEKSNRVEGRRPKTA